MESGTGLNYNAGTWHHPVLVLDDTLDLACIETQVSTGTGHDEPDARDCELLTYDLAPFGRIAVPEV
jgi:allantoicase